MRRWIALPQHRILNIPPLAGLQAADYRLPSKGAASMRRMLPKNVGAASMRRMLHGYRGTEAAPTHCRGFQFSVFGFQWQQLRQIRDTEVAPTLQIGSCA